MTVNQTLIDEAERLTPDLYESKVLPKRLVEVIADSNAFQGWRMGTVGDYEELHSKTFGKNESVTLDFGDHLVGYISFAVESVGSPPDAPLKLKLIFGEMPCEIGEPFDQYEGWLSSSWLQEETLFVDVLPTVVRLPRRYSFRYVKIQVVDASRKYRIQVTDVRCTTVTSADVSKVEPLPDHVPEDLKMMDRIAIKTLQDCMQTVYEDGPKRDRRLWIGDLRLQAQANYLTFRDRDVVKRCLYLFGGMTLPDGKVGACVFEKPAPHVDDTWLYDYSLFFVACLYDYYEATLDREALETLWPVALKQLKLGTERLGSLGVIVEDSTWWCFIDWNDDLNKQAPAQAVLLYTLKRGQRLARTLKDLQEEQWIADQIEIVSKAAMEHFWDSERGLFVSGEDKQVSWASQVWMTLAELLPQEENAKLFDRLHTEPPQIGMNTPYMYHHYIEAMFSCGKEEKAWEQLRAYWGEMVADGADTFWELYNPKDKKLSPYGSNLINSYCHAWSCTPTYFIRKYWLSAS
ncbi:sugar hydrolase [Paenibacillus sp. LHD-38]|uniref:alpha-L-rhamnosidase-related protein n=1 Tax=Paenibacillus sp. LHD-38 TaxID=3072143 RepID=UPI00281014FA|nr:sugar hydrolase [Paenibacillus sp. LHD-38]MDQ8738797.1 sugar hydrolase [Paenibacillus sp. LHD-38]